MIRRLATTADILKCYGEIIEQQTKRGFIEKVEEAKPTDRAHYIPHHPIRKESTTPPVKIVFDCSFHSSPNLPSLNDCLLTGSPFLNYMCAIPLRFRTFTYGLSADIEKAFLHVGLDANNRDSFGSRTLQTQRINFIPSASRPSYLDQLAPPLC